MKPLDYQSETVVLVHGLEGITSTSAMRVGLQEASDSALSRAEDLSEIEKKIVDR